jgi:predicted transposase YbfD/YdcC
MASEIRIGLDEVLRQFAELEDPRSEIDRRHSLVRVVVIALMAVLAGAGGRHRHRATGAGGRREDLAAQSRSEQEPRCTACGQHLGQRIRLEPGPSCDRREIQRNTAIRELLKLVDFCSAIITIDAMGTQTAIAAQIVDSQADYVLALKGSQEMLHNAVIDYVDAQLASDFADSGGRRHITKEKGHGREVIRHYVQMPLPRGLAGAGRWKGLLSIGVAMLFCIRDGKGTTDVRYFISSLPMGVKRFAHAVRAHWGIENTCHWSLDITYREDESHLREQQLRESFAWLNRFTLSLLKQHAGKASLIMKRRCCGWNNEFLLQTLTGTKS